MQGAGRFWGGSQVGITVTKPGWFFCFFERQRGDKMRGKQGGEEKEGRPMGGSSGIRMGVWARNCSLSAIPAR